MGKLLLFALLFGITSCKFKTKNQLMQFNGTTEYGEKCQLHLNIKDDNFTVNLMRIEVEVPTTFSQSVSKKRLYDLTSKNGDLNFDGEIGIVGNEFLLHTTESEVSIQIKNIPRFLNNLSNLDIDSYRVTHPFNDYQTISYRCENLVKVKK